MDDILRCSDRLKLFPVVHGSGDFAVRVRDELLSGSYDCVAVPLPASLVDPVLEGVERLPAISAVVQQEPDEAVCSYVPIDPCQPVIAALRFAVRGRLAIRFVDLETERFEPRTATLPDPYALKQVAPEKFAAALLPAIPRPPRDGQFERRIRRIAFELHRLELEHENVLCLCDLLDWPWIREAHRERLVYPEHERFFAPVRAHAVRPETLTFFLGELPFVTALYERARATLESDENLSIDGVKELVLQARDRWSQRGEGTTDWLTPARLQIYFRYVRNLSLLQRRLTPDLYTLVVAAQQIGGDGFALSLLETAKDYPIEYPPTGLEEMKMGIGRAELPGSGIAVMKNRLAGLATAWRSCELKPEPTPRRSSRWRTTWNPFSQCSWPIEDERIESFHTHVRQQAMALLGADLARAEKFTASVKDGIDIRETLRNWHTGDLYVKEIPPTRGGIEVVVFLFDVPADPKKYGWRTTWHAEHAEESTIGLFATDFTRDMVGPGIGRALYGGVFFIYPARFIPDIWTDPRLADRGPLEERLLAAALFHSREPHVAVVSPCPLRASWRRLAKRHGKRLIHLPLTRFSGQTVDRLRMVHVLDGKQVRSYAAHFIRDGR